VKLLPTLNSLALLYKGSMNHEFAESIYTKVLFITEKEFDKTDLRVKTCLEALLSIYLKKENQNQSEMIQARLKNFQ